VPDIDGPTHGYRDVLQAKDLIGHEAAVRRRARSAWEAWSSHHETVRRWAEVRGG
jgi:hypothetical protein